MQLPNPNPKRSCIRKDLESLIGHLNHACKVVRPGRSFPRRMIDLLHAIHHPPHSQIPIRLNANFRADLAWWATFATRWNGVAFLDLPSSWPQHHITTDASGSWAKSWFQVQWDATTQNLKKTNHSSMLGLGPPLEEHPGYMSLCLNTTSQQTHLTRGKNRGSKFSGTPLRKTCMLGLAVWAPRWRNTQVICHCDNQVTVACLRSRSSRVKVLMHRIRCLVYIEAQCGFHLSPWYPKPTHIPPRYHRS